MKTVPRLLVELSQHIRDIAHDLSRSPNCNNGEQFEHGYYVGGAVALKLVAECISRGGEELFEIESGFIATLAESKNMTSRSVQ